MYVKGLPDNIDLIAFCSLSLHRLPLVRLQRVRDLLELAEESLLELFGAFVAIIILGILAQGLSAGWAEVGHAWNMAVGI